MRKAAQHLRELVRRPVFKGLLVAVVVFRTSFLFGETGPFMRPYVLALDELSSDGDLLLHIPLFKWEIDGDTVIDVSLAHRQESMEYGEVRSNFDLLPFQTSMMPLGSKGWMWVRPGGGTMRFETSEPKPSARPVTTPSKKNNLSGPVRGLRQVFNNGKLRLTIWPMEDRQMIEDDGWELSYIGGILHALKSPNGHRLEVTASGRNITKISEQGLVRVKIDRSDAGIPTRLWVDGAVIAFEVSATNVISNVTIGVGGTVAGFIYHDNGLLASLVRPGVSARSFEWKRNTKYARGDSAFRKPYALQTAGDVQYGYDIRRDVIHLSEESLGRHKNLYIRMQYGKIRWISENHRP